MPVRVWENLQTASRDMLQERYNTRCFSSHPKNSLVTCFKMLKKKSFIIFKFFGLRIGIFVWDYVLVRTQEVNKVLLESESNFSNF